MNYKNLNWLWLTLPIVFLDQVTKYGMTTKFILSKQYMIFSWLNLHLSFNCGAAFSFLHHASGWQRWFLVSTAIIICCFMVIWLCRISREEKLIQCAISLIFAGAIGNLSDRIRLGYVIDFIEFHVKHWYFPTFNLADAAITLGAILLFIPLLLKE